MKAFIEICGTCIFFFRARQKIGSIFSDLFTLGFVALIIYVIYKTCISAQTGYAANNGYRPTGSGYQPPPPGFRDEYTQPGKYLITQKLK